MAADLKALLLDALGRTYEEGWKAGGHSALQALLDADPDNEALRTLVKERQSELSKRHSKEDLNAAGIARKNLTDFLQQQHSLAVPSEPEIMQALRAPQGFRE